MRELRGHRNRPIGVFDSGVGGLTVARELFKQLPCENVIYFGDTARYPYGPRSAEMIRRFSRQNVNFLLEHGVKFIVVACNTASGFALDYLKKIYNIPMMGVIEPGAQAAVELTRKKRIGVIGTEGTINSSSYQKALKNLNSSLKIFAKPCPLFVALAEEGYLRKPATKMIADEYLADLKTKRIDTLVLGCTHYPLLKDTISAVVGPTVRLVDSAEETARATKQALSKLKLSRESGRPGRREFYVSDSPEKFKKLGELFLGQKIGKVGLVDIYAY